jgi:hypothetical protein
LNLFALEKDSIFKNTEPGEGIISFVCVRKGKHFWRIRRRVRELSSVCPRDSRRAYARIRRRVRRGLI